MREIYQMFKGTLSPDAVLKAAGTRPGAQFYAHLYVGLYYDALDDAARARRAPHERGVAPLRQRRRLHVPRGDAASEDTAGHSCGVDHAGLIEQARPTLLEANSVGRACSGGPA